MPLAFSTTVAFGHEFWIDPLDFTLEGSENIEAELRVGQEFSGATYSYLPANFKLFEIARGAERVPVLGRMGDRPALNQAPAGEGLNVVLHVTKDYDLVYSELSKFETFVRHKDAAWTLDEHAAAGFPDTDIVEIYTRFAKSLVAVGNGEGEDREYGLLTEIVAQANPYTDDLSGGFPVRVLYEGKPRADVQVELFAKAPDGTVGVTLHRTDADGVATLPVEKGVTYLADAVVLRRASGSNRALKGAHWESLWASLTFAVPDE